MLYAFINQYYMKQLTKEVYYCEHCKKHGLSKYAMTIHELRCLRNPENHRPCFSCQNLTKKEAFIYSGIDDYYTSEPINDKKDFLFCEEKQIFLYTPINEQKNNFNHIDENGNNFENNLMPKFCSYKKSNDIHTLIDSA